MPLNFFSRIFVCIKILILFNFSPNKIKTAANTLALCHSGKRTKGVTKSTSKICFALPSIRSKMLFIAITFPLAACLKKAGIITSLFYMGKVIVTFYRK